MVLDLYSDIQNYNRHQKVQFKKKTTFSAFDILKNICHIVTQKEVKVIKNAIQ